MISSEFLTMFMPRCLNVATMLGSFWLKVSAHTALEGNPIIEAINVFAVGTASKIWPSKEFARASRVDSLAPDIIPPYVLSGTVSSPSSFAEKSIV